MMRRQKNPWIFLLLLLVGIVIGGFLGEMLLEFGPLKFLDHGESFGIALNRPFVLDLSIIQLSFALMININIFSIIGIIFAIVIFNKMG